MSEDTHLLRRSTVPPEKGATVFILLGVAISAWRRSEVVASSGAAADFAFEAASLVEPGQLAWSDRAVVLNEFSQAWIVHSVFEQCLKQAQGYQIQKVLFEALAVSFQNHSVWQSGGYTVQRNHQLPCAELVENVSTGADDLDGAYLDTAVGLSSQFTSVPRELKIELRSPVVAFGLLCMLSLVIHAMSYSTGFIAESTQPSTYPAMLWLEKLTSEQLGAGNVQEVRGIQNLQRLRVITHSPISNAQINNLEATLGVSVTRSSQEPVVLDLSQAAE